MIFPDRKRRTLHWAEAFGASAVVHLGAAILIFDLLDGLSPFDLNEQLTPEITLTSIVLESDIAPTPDQPLTNDPLADLATDGGEVEAEPELEPEPAVEPELEPDVAPEPELEPQTAEAPDLTPETLAPVAPETAQTPKPISPLRPQNGSAIPVAPVASVAARPATPATTVRPATATTLQPRQTFQPPPQATAQAPTPQGPTAGGAVSNLVTRIRAQLAEPCLLAIPQEGAGGTPELVMVSSSENGMQRFADAVLADLTPRPGQRTVLVDNRQCAALNYVRENPTYPAFRLSVSLDQATIESGSNLTGSIGNTAGRYISLLLIDDNGVVQDLGTYLSFTGTAARFDVPMTRAGGARDTSQTILALATAARPATLTAQNGQLADDFFAALRAEIGPNAPLVLVPFDVR